MSAKRMDEGARLEHGGSLRAKARAVEEAFRSFGERAEGFSRATGLSCAPGCGACCTYPHVEATPLEMLPAAVLIVDEGLAAPWLDALASTRREESHGPGIGRRISPCSFFEPRDGEAVDASGEGAAAAGSGGYVRGRCGRYAVRPLVCRLFGSGVRRAGTGERELLACRVMKDRDGARMAATASLLRDAAFDAPEAGPVFDALYAIDPALATERLPIDRALERALLRVALETSYQSDADPKADPEADVDVDTKAPRGDGLAAEGHP